MAPAQMETVELFAKSHAAAEQSASAPVSENRMEATQFANFARRGGAAL